MARAKKEIEEESEEEVEEEPADEISDVEKMNKNPWKLASFVLGIAVIVLLFMTFRGGITGNVIGGQDVGQNLIDFAKTQGVSLIINDVSDEGSFYSISYEVDGKDSGAYVTKDGKYLISPIAQLTENAIDNSNTNTNTEQPPQDVPKSDKPVVELFVMTHCPYGTQAEKGFIPALELLGDKIDGSIKFVHYFLHAPEEEETPRQVCIREEEPDKYLDYLKCFLEDGDADRCIDEVGISNARLNSCTKGNAEEYYASDSALSEGYGVRGSPSLVINGQQVSSGRDSASYLAAICSAFNNPPEECQEVLDSASPSPGFGYDASSSGGSTQAQC